ncbi:hypothetical protein ALC60_02733 [Trachymyrmex zeteki]|uniref:Uncharacterized protein n=1 Tax=Mycetomoellerius zeteki TaxID=64791 RepID=A0A151XD75_9HYME|nr:hypothetical protein ALC60_02733 [Trachymyrmex zeteki]
MAPCDFFLFDRVKKPLLGDKVTRKNGAEEQRGKKEKVKEEDEGRGAAGGDGRLVPFAPGRTPSVVIPRGSLARFRGKKVVGDERAAERGPPEFPSREPTNQTKRDKDKQRFEPTSTQAGERIKRRHAECGYREGREGREGARGERKMRKEGSKKRWVGTEEAQQALVKYDVRSLPFVQLVATRRNATASSLPSSSPSCSYISSSSQTFPLSPFLLIFVARCIHHVHRYAIAYNVLDTFCRRSIDSIDSIEEPEKGPLPLRGPDKDDAMADSGNRKAQRTLREYPAYTPSTFRSVHYVVTRRICSYLRVTMSRIIEKLNTAIIKINC